MRDENQIAASILRIATTTEPRPGESPRHRANRANGAGLAQMALRGGQASAAKVPLELRRANGLKGAITTVGSTLSKMVGKELEKAGPLAYRLKGETPGATGVSVATESTEDETL